jgi:hypothetical protein
MHASLSSSGRMYLLSSLLGVVYNIGPLVYGAYIKMLKGGRSWGQVRGSPLLACPLQYIYIYVLSVTIYLGKLLAEVLSVSLWPNLAWSLEIWRTCQILFFSNFQLRVVIGNFPTTMWKPMTGPRGNLLLDHVIHYTINMPR